MRLISTDKLKGLTEIQLVRLLDMARGCHRENCENIVNELRQRRINEKRAKKFSRLKKSREI